MAFRSATMPVEARYEPRDEVHYRARGRCPAGQQLNLLVVNTSAGGLMARSPADHRPGDRLRLSLPVIGDVVAEVRWALGGRIGCQFERVVEPAAYDTLLIALRR